MPKSSESKPTMGIPHVESLFTPIGMPTSIETALPDTSSGDEIALGEVYANMYGRVLNRTRYRTPSLEDAEDLTQTTFLQAFRNREQYVPMNGIPLDAWVFTINHNLIASFFRKRPLPTADIAAWEDNIPDEHIEKTINENIEKAIQHLKPVSQQVIVGRFIFGLSHQEVATSVGKSEGAVRVIQTRALRELKTIMRTRFK